MARIKYYDKESQTWKYAETKSKSVKLYDILGQNTDGALTQKKATDELNNKVDKVNGKDLSTNDYTTEEKNKLASIEEGANKVTNNNQLDNGAGYIKNELNAFDYSNLKDKPNIPTKTSDLTNDGDGVSNFATESYVNQNGGKIDKIKVNGEEQLISPTDKSVDISVPTDNNQIANSSGYITKDANNLTNYTLTTGVGADLGLTLDTTNYKMTLDLKNSVGTVLSTKTIDFPIESMVISASYENGILTLTLQNGETLDVDISSIISGLVADTRKIAGFDLKDDITANELISSLGISNKVDKELKTGSENEYKVLSDNNLTDDLKTQIEANTTDKHTHNNKLLLDTYNQTNEDLTSAVELKHNHSNKAILDNTTASFTLEDKTEINKVKDKVDKDGNKVLSTNDFTNEYKNQIDTNTSNILNKQDKIVAGNNITIDEDGKTINATQPDVSSFITKDVDNLTNYTTTTDMNALLDSKQNNLTQTQLNNINDVQNKLDKSGGTLTGTVNLGQGDNACLQLGNDGRINAKNTTNTVFGLIGGQVTLGHTSMVTNIRGSSANPKYNGNDLALKSELPDISGKQPNLTSANAGDNITITGSGSNVKISSTGGSSTPTNMVTTDTEQTITGKKTFTQEIHSNGAITAGGNVSGNYIVGNWLKTLADIHTESSSYDIPVLVNKWIYSRTKEEFIRDCVYPVGSIYMSVNATNPATIFGGKWVAWGSGRVPLAMGNNGETNYTTVEQTGGSENSVAAHTHNNTISVSGTQDSHYHSIDLPTGDKTWSGGSSQAMWSKSRKSWNTNSKQPTVHINSSISNASAGTTGGNRMPYITCYMWKRTE